MKKAWLILVLILTVVAPSRGVGADPGMPGISTVPHPVTSSIAWPSGGWGLAGELLEELRLDPSRTHRAHPLSLHGRLDPEAHAMPQLPVRRQSTAYDWTPLAERLPYDATAPPASA